MEYVYHLEKSGTTHPLRPISVLKSHHPLGPEAPAVRATDNSQDFATVHTSPFSGPSRSWSQAALTRLPSPFRDQLAHRLLAHPEHALPCIYLYGCGKHRRQTYHELPSTCFHVEEKNWVPHFTLDSHTSWMLSCGPFQRDAGNGRRGLNWDGEGITSREDGDRFSHLSKATAGLQAQHEDSS